MGEGANFDLAPLSDEPPIHVGASAESFFDFVSEPAIPTRVIAPVAIGGVAGISEPLNPFMQQILRNTSIPKFDWK